jgi:pimeloyl-ACP methyl ester carboxylesterase
MFISAVDAEIFTVEFGNGPRTLVAHGGWAGSWELWTLPFAVLSKTWRTIAYDHRGAGATVAPTESISLQAMVNDLFAVLDALNVKTCVLAAESAGVVVALSAALQQPQRFEGLVLIDGLYHQPMPTGPDPFVLGLRADFETTIGRFVDACVAETEPKSAAIRRWGRQILRRSSMPSAVRLYEAMFGVDLRPEIARITQPTLIIHGDRDALVPLEASQWLAAHLPHNALHVVQGAGHVPTVTRPHEVAQAINQYFAAR